MNQANKILMIRPTSFSYNTETAVNNYYQKKDESIDSVLIAKKVTEEFDKFKMVLEKNNIVIYLFEDIPDLQTPDSVFPNNWISTHNDGSIFLYPMFAKNRRMERREDIINFLIKQFSYSRVIDISSIYEKKNEFLEGTGSMVIDRSNRLVYAALSERTNKNPLTFFCEKIKFDLISFYSFQKFDSEDKLIYHTNVMMSVCEDFIIICLESVKDDSERDKLLECFLKTKKQIIDITYDQVNNFCGNVLELKNKDGDNILIMSTKAYNSFTKTQKDIINNFCKIVHSSLDNIEKYGGGGARCMVAEIFLKPN